MHVAAIIAAGGVGTRIGGPIPKQFQDLGDGTLMLERTMKTIAACALIDEVVVALPQGWFAGSDEGQPEYGKPLTHVPGGERRQDSVANAFARLSDAADLVVIHDAARPFASVDLIERTIRAAWEHGAAIAAVPATDTVKRVGAASPDGSRVIQGTLPRDTIYLAQTPQAFRRDVLAHAMAGAGDANVTDEAMLVERAGFQVHVVEGDPENFKVTTQRDFASARAMAGGGRPAVSGISPGRLRIGTGYDLHRLVSGRPLILGGVRIPFELGLEGHSDADIVCHAVTDAVLGAASAGDIGRMFPSTDPRWKDADSIVLLREAMKQVSGAGYRAVNIDITVVAERPKLLPHLEAMRVNVAKALGLDLTAISIKGKTNEGVDAIGRGEAMACHAVALLVTV